MDVGFRGDLARIRAKQRMASRRLIRCCVPYFPEIERISSGSTVAEWGSVFQKKLSIGFVLLFILVSDFNLSRVVIGTGCIGPAEG